MPVSARPASSNHVEDRGYVYAHRWHGERSLTVEPLLESVSSQAKPRGPPGSREDLAERALEWLERDSR